MSKKQDNNSQNNNQQRQKKPKSNPQPDDQPVPKTPQKKLQQPIQEQIFQFMQPFPLPPKINYLFTASSNGNYAYSHDMKVIQTPYTHQNQRFISNDIEDMHDDLRPITGKIFWQKTPAKSEQSSSEFQDSSSNQSRQQIVPQSDQSASQFEDNQSSQENPQKQEHIQKPKSSTQKIERQKTFTKRINHQRRLQQFSVPQPNSFSSGKKVFCNCKKTKCLKLYCDCFRINQTCDGCNCMGCHNLEEYAQERNNAILALMDRNPDPFSQKIHEDKHLKGCNCKKSFCLKKYCECYQAGLKCGQNCKCDQCKNGGGSQKRERDRLQRQGFQMRQAIASI